MNIIILIVNIIVSDILSNDLCAFYLKTINLRKHLARSYAAEHASLVEEESIAQGQPTISTAKRNCLALVNVERLLFLHENLILLNFDY